MIPTHPAFWIWQDIPWYSCDRYLCRGLQTLRTNHDFSQNWENAIFKSWWKSLQPRVYENCEVDWRWDQRICYNTDCYYPTWYGRFTSSRWNKVFKQFIAKPRGERTEEVNFIWNQWSCDRFIRFLYEKVNGGMCTKWFFVFWWEIGCVEQTGSRKPSWLQKSEETGDYKRWIRK